LLVDHHLTITHSKNRSAMGGFFMFNHRNPVWISLGNIQFSPNYFPFYQNARFKSKPLPQTDSTN